MGEEVMLNGDPVIEAYNAACASTPVAAEQVSFCGRCRNRGIWYEQVDGATNLRRVICPCGAYYAPGTRAVRIEKFLTTPNGKVIPFRKMKS